MVLQTLVWCDNGMVRGLMMVFCGMSDKLWFGVVWFGIEWYRDMIWCCLVWCNACSLIDNIWYGMK